jgi:hypothetical protein
MKQSFERIYCKRYEVRKAEFSQDMLLRSCAWYIRPAVMLILFLRPGCLEEELNFFSSMRSINRRSDVIRHAGSLHPFYRECLPTWRRRLGIRASGRRIALLSRLLY